MNVYFLEKPYEFSPCNNHQKIIQQRGHGRGRRNRKDFDLPTKLMLYLKSPIGKLSDNQLQLYQLTHLYRK